MRFWGANDLLEPQRRQPSPIQELANILSRRWMPLHDNLWKDHKIAFARDWPMSRNTWTLHQVCAWSREAERRNNSTPIPYKISSRTSGQTMLLLCLKWHFSLEWIQTNCKNTSNSESLQTSCYTPKSWQNGILLCCSCISTLGPSRHAVKHRSLWSNQYDMRF